MQSLFHRCDKSVTQTHGVRCALPQGHTGDCKSEGILLAERQRNANPTLEDIRLVIREEIKAAQIVVGGGADSATQASETAAAPLNL